MYPVSVSAYQVKQRHEFLVRLTNHVKPEEVTSYGNMHTCLVTVTACVGVFSVMEVAVYFLYLFKVSNIAMQNSLQMKT